MLRSLMQKVAFLYKPYALAIVSIGYVLGELGHFLIGKPRRYPLQILLYESNLSADRTNRLHINLPHINQLQAIIGI